MLTLQQAGFSVLEEAKKLLPKDVAVPPEALRCEYPLHTSLNAFAMCLFGHACFLLLCSLTSAQVPWCSYQLRMPKNKSTAMHKWTFCAVGVVAEKQMSVKCTKAKDQGVPLPDGWHVALRAMLLPKTAERSAVKAMPSGQSVGHCTPLPEL